AAIVACGLGPGERFALMMRNHPEFVETMVAASLTGCVFVPIDPRTRGDKLAYTLNDAGCRGVVCADYCLEQLNEIRRDAPDIGWVLALDSGECDFDLVARSTPGLSAIGEALASAPATVDARLGAPGDPLQIIYTSGTTGDPKGVVFPNDRFGLFGMLGALMGYGAGDRPYTGLSLTHGNAQAVTLGPSLHMGLRGVLSPKFTKSRLWAICRRLGCTTFSLLGGMATAVYAEPEAPEDGHNPVRLVISAGMPAAIWESFEQRFGVQVFEWYGAVEGGLAFKPPGVGPLGSFGKPAPGLEMKVVDEEGADCPPGVVGEIVSRPQGGKAEVEYFGNEEASEQKTAGGWLHSGDMGHVDADGWFFFDYRKGGGIRHNGDFVNPGFVEKVIAEHPMVSDVFVYGVSAASGAPGEKDVVAAVTAADPASFSAASVFKRCHENLEANFVPSYIQLVDEIPKTASEKPQERFLLERFAANGEGVFTED
ncbi:MAG: AMP-binding protein, partial [Candidatus Binatia bacterium]